MKKKMTLREEIKKRWFFYLLPIPGLVYMLFLNYIPMAGLYMVFENYTLKGGMFGSEFIGLRNFRTFFDNIDYILRATRNTVVINVLQISLGTITNIAFAIILNEIISPRFRKITQTMILFPYFLSMIIVGLLAQGLLNDNGFINDFLNLLGFESVSWYFTPKAWWPIIVIVLIWKGFGYNSIIYYSTIMGFDPALYEAADIDGATRWQKIWRITLPQLKTTVTIMSLLAVGHVLQLGLDTIIGLTNLNPALLETTDTLATYVYRVTMETPNYGMSSVSSLYSSVIGCILVLVANFAAKKMDPDYALF